MDEDDDEEEEEEDEEDMDVDSKSAASFSPAYSPPSPSASSSSGSEEYPVDENFDGAADDMLYYDDVAESRAKLAFSAEAVDDEAVV